SLTSIPEGFNPTVGGSLDLRPNCIKPEGWKKSEHENMPVNIPEPFIKWGKGKGDYIYCDGRFSEVISKKGNIWELKDLGKNNRYYLVSDGKGKYAHGETIKEAREDLVFKISNRDKSEYKGLDVDKKFPYEKCIEMYRVITGACSAGTKNFIVSRKIQPQAFTIRCMVKLTKGEYGANAFKAFFNL
ncbi:hypothetical protein SAMN05192529_13153, partial [Arachidicoccus rhizosphaerae]